MTQDNPCELVAERLAVGEPLGDQADHAAVCPRCTTLQSTASQLGRARQAIDPGTGFAARMTVAAQHRIGVRHRRRVAAGFAGVVAASALCLVVVTRTPDATTAPADHVAVKAPQPEPPAPVADDPEDPGEAEALRMLVRLSDVERNSQVSARWSQIQRPLKPYRALVKGTTP